MGAVSGPESASGSLLSVFRDDTDRPRGQFLAALLLRTCRDAANLDDSLSMSRSTGSVDHAQGYAAADARVSRARSGPEDARESGPLGHGRGSVYTDGSTSTDGQENVRITTPLPRRRRRRGCLRSGLWSIQETVSVGRRHLVRWPKTGAGCSTAKRCTGGPWRCARRSRTAGTTNGPYGPGPG